MVGNKGTTFHCLASEWPVCECLGRGKLLGGPRKPAGTCCLRSGIWHLLLPSAWGCGESLSVALGFSCSDLLLSPSSASSPEFPSSESLGWFVSAHLGVWDISRAWFQDSERTQEDLPLRLFGLGAPGMLRCRETPTPGLGKPPSNSDGAAVGGWTTTSFPGSPVLTTRFWPEALPWVPLTLLCVRTPEQSRASRRPRRDPGVTSLTGVTLK